MKNDNDTVRLLIDAGASETPPDGHKGRLLVALGVSGVAAATATGAATAAGVAATGASATTGAGVATTGAGATGIKAGIGLGALKEARRELRWKPRCQRPCHGSPVSRRHICLPDDG